jgi:hypothetical protein
VWEAICRAQCAKYNCELPICDHLLQLSLRRVKVEVEMVAAAQPPRSF